MHYPFGLRVVFSYIPMRKEECSPQTSHRAGFFYFTTKEVFRWLTIKRIFPTLKGVDNCIGVFDVPDPRKNPERDILLKTKKGIALSYVPTQIAI